jgi:dipeptidyl aminopeptidase/acylaminoacyl peptidase
MADSKLAVLGPRGYGAPLFVYMRRARGEVGVYYCCAFRSHWPSVEINPNARSSPIYASVCAKELFHFQVLCSDVSVLDASGCPSCGGGTPAEQRRIQLEDLTKIVTVSDPQISPDGKSIVCVVSRQNFDEDRSDGELVLIDVASGGQRVLTYDRKGIGSPRWSPSGDRLAFVAVVPYVKGKKDDTTKRGDSPQVFVLPMSGGDAKKITNAPNGVEQFAWRPNGMDIAYVTSDEQANQKEIEKHNDSFEVGDNDYLASGAPTSSHIWLVSAEGEKTKRLTSGPWSLPKSAPPSSPASPISWTPDGKSLTFTRQEQPHFGDADLTTLQILNVESGEIRKLTSHEKFESFGLFSPDGSQLAYWYPRDSDPNNVNEIFVTSAGGGNGIDLTRDIDRNLQRAIWMPDGQSLLVGGHDGTQVSLWLQPLKGKARKLSLGDVNPAWLFWIDAAVGPQGEIAFTGSTASHPSELYYMASANDAPKRLTNFNREMAEVKFGKVEHFDWQGPDGFREDGVLVYPPDFSKDKKYPLVLLVHGGPTAASTSVFGGPAHLMAARDYIIFQPNYRGSDNLGNAYQRAIYNDAGDGPGRDVMAGIEAVKKLGFIDETKIAVTGWSYGGYMTSWLIGHYHIWRTAVTGASVTDLNQQYNLSDGNVGGRYSFKGSPWTGTNMKDYLAQSPIAFASQIRTPTLILSDTGDARVPVTQSYQLFHAMKDNGVTVKFVAYPVGGHFPGDPVRSRDVYSRWIGWLDQYLK